MLLKELCSAVDGKVICGESRLDESVDYAFASDLMSDVLTIKIDNFVLITGLANLQTIRTAEMSDIQYILFARGKKATSEIVDLASDNDIVVIESPYSLFRCCGVLYGRGLKAVY